MKELKVLETITSDILEVKKQSRDMVSVDALLEYLNALKNNLSNTQEMDESRLEIALTEYRAEHENKLALFDLEKQNSIEMFRSVISFGQEALKSPILINGGAAVALLAFIGNIWTKGINQYAVKFLNGNDFFYSCVASAAFGTALSYAIQYCYSKKWNRTGKTIHILACLFIFSAFFFFVYGSWNAYIAFTTHLTK